MVSLQINDGGGPPSLVVSWSTIGSIVNVCGSVAGTAQLVIGKQLKRRFWPYYRLLGFGLVPTVLCILLCLFLSGAAVPRPSERKWVVARGLFGAFTFFCITLAVRFGAPSGDSAALTSTNCVVAAAAGRFLLSEKLQWSQIIAVLVCLTGTALISKPEFLFGSRIGAEENAWIGYCCAMAGGAGLASISLCSRMVRDVSPIWPAVATLSLMSVCFFVAPALGLIDDATVDVALASPLEAGPLIVILVGLVCFVVTTNTAAGQWCPPAVCATVGTAARILCGYIAEVVCFGTIPDLVTICGAFLMFSCVVVMVKSQSSKGLVRLVSDVEDVTSPQHHQSRLSASVFASN